MIQLSLRQEESRLIYLAVAYHLGRPGSELDPLTKQPVEHGLAEVARDLQPQLRLAVATINLQDNQVQRLLSGMLGSITELKAYPMLERRPDADGGERRSSVAGFDRSLSHLFPEVDEDAENAMAIAERDADAKTKPRSAIGGANGGDDGRREAVAPARLVALQSLSAGANSAIFLLFAKYGLLKPLGLNESLP